MSKPIVSPILINGKPVGRVSQDGNILLEGDDAIAVGKQSHELKMELLFNMPYPDRLFCITDALIGPQKRETFSSLSGILMGLIAEHRAPGCCPCCGCIQPLSSHLCRHDGDHANFVKAIPELYGSIENAIAKNDELRRDVGFFSTHIGEAVRQALNTSKVDKGYVRTAFDVLKLANVDNCFNYTEAALAVCSHGNMIDDLGEEVWKKYNRDTLTILKWCPYNIYLKTDHWQRVRYAAIERAGHRCQVCNKHFDDTVLQAHHRTYDRRGEESPTDITILCVSCHSAFHKNGKVAR